MPTLIEERQKLEAKQKELKDKFDSYELKDLPDGTKARDIPANDLEGINTLHNEINALGKSVDALRKAEEAAEDARKALEDKNRRVTPDNGIPIGDDPAKSGKPPVKSLADQFFGSDAWKNRDRHNVKSLDIMLPDSAAEVKTLMTTTADGYPPQVVRDGTVVPIIMRPPQLIDFLRMEPTDQNGIKFMKQTVRTNAAAGKAEGAAAGEAVLTWAESTDAIERIPVTIPMTDIQAEDEPEVRGLVERDLILMVRQELDRQVTVGNGTPPEIRGIFNASAIQTQAKGTDDRFTAIAKAIWDKVNLAGRANPNLVVLHTSDWRAIITEKTADGQFILGHPANFIPQRLWGLNVAISDALTATNGIVLDTDYFRIKLRRDVTVQMTDSHSDEFTKGIIRLMATARAGLKKMRDEAACKVTGL